VFWASLDRETETNKQTDSAIFGKPKKKKKKKPQRETHGYCLPLGREEFWRRGWLKIAAKVAPPVPVSQGKEEALETRC
jgi:hypothetical protein